MSEAISIDTKEVLTEENTAELSNITSSETSPSDNDQTAAALGEFTRTEPSERKRMGLTELTLDKGVKTEVIGHLYGMDFTIETDVYRVRLFFDHYNFRLKILDYEATDYRAMVERVNWLAAENGFEKIFWKAAEDDWHTFLTFGYQMEGVLKYYFAGEDAYVMSKFRTLERVQSDELIAECELIEQLMRLPRQYTPKPLPKGYELVLATREHIPQLVELYRSIFQTYPSPLTHPDYILQTMERNIIYRAILNDEGRIVSAASADVDFKHRNAELTDCATDPSQRGKGLMYHILESLENDLRERDMVTAYTLARGQSFGMNLVFYRLGHEFCGRLINNCDIYGQFEDMNIWAKKLNR